MAGVLSKTKRLLKQSEVAKTALILALVVGGEYALFFGLRAAFRTEYLPFHPVSSESMVPTLKVGDLIMVTGTEPRNVKVSQIIVFHNPRNHEMLIVHRVMRIIEKDGVLYFETKGDNNPGADSWSPYPGVPERLLVGVVIGTIPYVGHVILFLKEPIGMMGIVLLTALVVIYEFVIPLTRRRKSTVEPEKGRETTHSSLSNGFWRATPIPPENRSV